MSNSTARPLPEYPRSSPSDLERMIATNVARYVRDGSCIQVGIGKLSEAVLQAIADPFALESAYRAALDNGYLWHELGDLHLILPDRP